MKRLMVHFKDEEYSALLDMAHDEMRSPENQVRWILCEAAKHRLSWSPPLQIDADIPRSERDTADYRP